MVTITLYIMIYTCSLLLGNIALKVLNRPICEAWYLPFLVAMTAGEGNERG